MLANPLLFSLLLLLLPSLPFTTAHICFPPTHALPTRVDCVALILGLSHLARQPRDEGAKRWGRTLSTGPRTEKLPRWYYLVDETQPPATCALVVDAGGEASEVDSFSLADVVDSAKEVYSNCLIEKGQVGLEFPGEGHIFVRLLRLDGHPRGLLGVDHIAIGEREGKRMVVPGGRGVLYVSESEPGRLQNVSVAS